MCWGFGPNPCCGEVELRARHGAADAKSHWQYVVGLGLRNELFPWSIPEILNATRVWYVPRPDALAARNSCLASSNKVLGTLQPLTKHLSVTRMALLFTLLLFYTCTVRKYAAACRLCVPEHDLLIMETCVQSSLFPCSNLLRMATLAQFFGRAGNTSRLLNGSVWQVRLHGRSSSCSVGCKR